MATESTLQYIKFDYASHREAILQRVRARWPLVWNDFLANSIGTMMVDLIAWSTATLAYMVNRLAGENFISTMTLRESAQRIGSLVGYQLRGATPATVMCEAALPQVLSQDVTILSGTIVRTSGDIAFETDQDYIIYAGALTPVETIVTFSSVLTGQTNIQSNISVVNGVNYVDCLDTTIDLNDYIEAGQTFQALGGSTALDTLTYIIEGITQAPGAVSNNRILIDRAWEGTTSSTAAQVYDTRIALIQGQTVTDRFISPAATTLSYTIKLSRTPVIDNSIVMQINGETWTQVTSMAVTLSTDQVFEAKTLSSGQTVCVFGDGTFGAVVPTEATVIATYRIGGGASGNIQTGAVDTSITGIIAVTNTPVSIALTNTAAGVGGQDAMTLEEARVAIPAYIKTNDRAVTSDDYRTLAMNFSNQYGTVKYARSVVRIQNSLLEGNTVVIYAWAQGTTGGLTSLNATLKSTLQTYMQTKAVGTDYVIISNGTTRPLPLSLRFKVFEGFNATTTRSLVLDTVQSILNGMLPGDTLFFSNLMAKLDTVYGVDTVNISTPITDLTPDNPNETFIEPSDSYEYTIEISVQAGTHYSGRSTVIPLAAWGIRVFIDSVEATVIPDSEAGYARIIGGSIAPWDFGLIADRPTATATNEGLYYLATDQNSPTGILYKSIGSNWVQQSSATSISKSTIDLRTGEINIYTTGTVGSFKMRLISAQGYDRERPLNVYIGYTTTDNSQTKRREIRSAIRSWFDQVGIAKSVYARKLTGNNLSYANITDIVRSVSSVVSVTRVALDTPTSTAERVDTTDFELIRPGSIVLNNNVD